MNLKTNKLLLVSVVIFAVTFILSAFWEVLGFGSKESPRLAFALMIAFGINIAGLIISFSENKIDRKKAKIGFWGNLILLIVFLSMSGYALMTMDELTTS